MRDELAKLIHKTVPRPAVNFAWSLGADLKTLPRRFEPGRKPEPWRVLHNVGGGDFHGLGARYFALFKQAVGLKPGDHVLDIGCGTGRIAFALAEYLDETGRYTGFDVSERAIAWARRHVRGKAPFSFIHAPAGNHEYGSRGAPAREYGFPAEDASVDAALAISLFTHLLPEDAAHYLNETGRVLREGGRLYLTAFMIGDEARARIESGEARLRLHAYRDAAWAADTKEPERAIGFDQARFEDWMRSAGLRYAQPVEPGNWSMDRRTGEYQDRIVLERAG